MCSYSGTLSDGDPAELVVSNAVDVDDEGGTVSSAIKLTVIQNDSLGGTGTNEYVHPKGFSCRWNMGVAFSRELDEDEKKE